MSISVIVVCPCCASAQDATADPDLTDQDFECTGCGQRWSMQVDADRHRQYALH